MRVCRTRFLPTRSRPPVRSRCPRSLAKDLHASDGEAVTVDRRGSPRERHPRDPSKKPLHHVSGAGFWVHKHSALAPTRGPHHNSHLHRSRGAGEVRPPIPGVPLSRRPPGYPPRGLRPQYASRAEGSALRQFDSDPIHPHVLGGTRVSSVFRSASLTSSLNLTHPKMPMPVHR